MTFVFQSVKILSYINLFSNIEAAFPPLDYDIIVVFIHYRI